MLLFLGVYFGNSSVGWGQYIVNSPEDWDANTDLTTKTDWESGIIIKAKLSITNLTLAFYSTSKIQIDWGETLELDNVILKHGGAPSTSWGGIFTDDPCIDPHNQYYTLPNPTILNNSNAWEGVVDNRRMGGRLFMKNSTIQNAKIGINVYCDLVVRARNCNFINNEIGCKFFAQEWTGTDDEYNASYLMDCNFEWNSDFDVTGFDESKITGIEIKWVRGLRLGGCSFKNTRVATCKEKRGVGIFAQDPTFFLSQSGTVFCGNNSLYDCTNNCNPSTRNKFESLSIGIKAIETDKNLLPRRYVAQLIQNSDFTNNFNSIDIKAFRFKIIDCNFNGNRSELDQLFNSVDCNIFPAYSATSTIKDIITKECDNYEIYNNTFQFTGKNITHIVNEGTNFSTSNIQLNTFTNNNSQTIASDNVIGIIAIGTNSQLNLKCNTFIDLGTDVMVGGSNSINQMQGSNARAAGNTFSNPLINRHRINNSSGTIIAYYYSGVGNPSNSSYPSHDPAANGVFGLNPLFTTNITEGNDCKILCSKFISNIKSININKEVFKIIPMPANNEIKLVLNQNNTKQYIGCKIYDIRGKLVKSVTIENLENIVINTSDFNNGLFLIILIDTNNIATSQKLLIQH